VTDFGLAKAEGADGLTQAGDIVGTLRYMPPERFAGRSDPRGDVYALGVTLYEMLTLRPAFGETLRPRLIEQVLKDDPPRPRRLDPHVPRDLETVVLKAIEKEPGRRYPSAGELAADLRRYLAGEPLRARRAGPAERAAKWVRRRPAAAALLAVIAAALVTVAAGSLAYNARLETALGEAEANLDKARRAEREKTEQLGLSYLHQAQASRWSGRAGQRFDSLEALRRAAASFRALGTLPDHVLELRNEAVACLTLADLGPAWEWPLKAPWTRFHAFDRACRHYAVGDDDENGGQKWISVRRVADHEEVARLPGPGVYAHTVEFSADGRYLSAVYHRPVNWRHKQLWVWDLRRGEPVLKLAHANGSDFSPDGRRLAVNVEDGSARVYDLPSGKERARLSRDLRGDWLGFDPDGRRLAVVHESRPEVAIVNVDGGQVLATLRHPGGAYRVAWRGDGRLLAAGCEDHCAYVWDLADPARPRLLQTLKGHQAPVLDLGFSHGGQVLATSGWDGTTRLWEPLTGRQLVATDHGSGWRFRADDRRLVFLQRQETFGLWRLALGAERRAFRGHAGHLWGAQISPDGRLMVSAGDDGVRFWDLAAGTEAAKALTARQGAGRTRAVLHGDALITAGEAGLQRWPLRVDWQRGIFRLGTPRTIDLSADRPLPDVRNVALSPDGRTAAVVLFGLDNVLLFDLDRPDRARRLAGHAGLDRVGFSPDGRWLVSGNWHGAEVKVWDARTGAPEKVLPFPQSAHAVFSPDGRWLVTSTGQEYQFLEAGSWRLVRRLARERAGDVPGGMAFTRDGRTLALSHSRSLVRLIDPATGAELATLPAAGPPLCFSPDGRLLATVGENHAIDVWDLRLIRRQLAALGLDWELPGGEEQAAASR
jgi:WD40 repeat protein